MSSIDDSCRLKMCKDGIICVTFRFMRICCDERADDAFVSVRLQHEKLEKGEGVKMSDSGDDMLIV